MTTAFNAYRTLSQGFPVTLPSGLTVTVRRISLPDYLERGELPVSLQAVTTRMAQILHGADDVEVTHAEVQHFKSWIVSKAVLDLSITLDKAQQDDQTLHISEIPEQDKEAIYTYAFGDISKAVETFTPFFAAPSPDSSTPSPSDTDSGPQPSSASATP